MRLVGYLRVSTREQAENGYGLPQQRAQITAWAKRCGHTIALWESDEGQSGSNGIEHRAALSRALQAIEEGQAEGLVVKQLDRLSRDLMLQEWLLARIWKFGGKVFSTLDAENSSLSDEGADPTQNLTRQILGAIAEYERKLIVMRMRAGKLAKQEEGGYIGGKVPYGYENGPGGLVPVESELETVRRMQSLRNSGATFAAIADDLNRSETPTKNGGQWTATTVRRILLRQR